MDREQAKANARADLKKPYLELLADVHQELGREDRRMEENLIHAQKRLASLQARAALSADRAANVMIVMTGAILLLTVVLLWLTYLLYAGEG